MRRRTPPRRLRDSVVVITGGSSGIGRAMAVRLAREGARLVLAARAPGPLQEAAAECIDAGGDAVAIPTDVREQSAVAALAQQALDRFGAIDTWINNAGVIAFGSFAEIPPDVFRAVVETNLFGQVHGSRAAVEQFRRQGHGVLVNISSVWGRATSDEVNAYVTSKFAVRAFTASLRQDLARDPGIRVITILPQAMDTPIFANGANYSGQVARPIPPLLDPEVIAGRIVEVMRRPDRDEVTFSRSGRVVDALHDIAPPLYNRLVAPAFQGGLYSALAADDTSGNVLHPQGGHEVSGHWRATRRGELWRAAGAAALAVLRCRGR